MSQPPTNLPPRKAVRVLLADDEPHIRRYVRLLLRELGLTDILEATDGEAALRVVREAQPDLIVIDLNMPLQDGLESISKLRDLGWAKPVVVLSSMANRRTVEECARMEVFQFIRKDTPRAEMRELLREVLMDAGLLPEEAAAES